MRSELMQYDTTRSGKLDSAQFKRAMKQLSIAMTDAEIKDLFETGDSKRDSKGHLDIVSFVQQVQAASKQKPLPSFLTTTPSKPGSKVQSRIGMGSAMANTGAAGAFENWEVEKKYKKNLEALKQEIEERNNEILIAKKEVQDVNNRVLKLEAEKRELETKFVDRYAKPPREMHQESQA